MVSHYYLLHACPAWLLALTYKTPFPLLPAPLTHHSQSLCLFRLVRLSLRMPRETMIAQHSSIAESQSPFVIFRNGSSERFRDYTARALFAEGRWMEDERPQEDDGG